METRFLLSIVAITLAVSGGARGEDDFRPLFNGKDLAGWVEVNTAPSTWSFNEEGYLVCSGKPIGEIRTEKMYQNFIMEIEWRHLKPRGNAGIFVWADDITARGQPFHRGVEVQVLENAYGQGKGHTTHGDIFPIHGAKMTPVNGRGGSRAFPTEERSKPSPEWNHYRIECQDGNISLAVNGKVVTRGKDASPKKGYLCIESEGGVVHYRNAKIKELPVTPIDPEDVAIADRGYRSLYNGVNLSGWKKTSNWEPRDWVLSVVAAGKLLVSEESFGGDFGVLFDVRLNEKSGTPSVSVGGFSRSIDPEEPTLKGLLAETGKWNRFEISRQDSRVTVLVNGKPSVFDRPFDFRENNGPFMIDPHGPADWANLFVRDLTGKQAARIAPKGHLIIHGGGPLTKEVARKIFELGGGKEGHIVIVPTSAEGDLETDSESAPGFIKTLGFGKVTVLHTRDPEVAAEKRHGDLVFRRPAMADHGRLPRDQSRRGFSRTLPARRRDCRFVGGGDGAGFLSRPRFASGQSHHDGQRSRARIRISSRYRDRPARHQAQPPRGHDPGDREASAPAGHLDR